MNERAMQWPLLEYSAWKQTCTTLQLWSQIVGKIKIALCTPESHWWHVALHVTQRGLTSGPIPYREEVFEIVFDFVRHHLTIATNSGQTREIKLEAKSVKTFYSELCDALSSLGIDVKIDTLPKEIANPVPFDRDETHESYDAKSVEDFRTVLLNCDRAFRQFQAKFCGKSSPVLFFWGSFDLTAVRFSGRNLPAKDANAAQAEVEEEFALGFWPGSETYPKAAFYAYAIPAPEGYYASSVKPKDACFDKNLGELILDYDAVRNSSDPYAAILEFADSTYEALAEIANWDRKHLERVILEPIP